MTTLLWTACQKETLPVPGASSQVQENLTPRIADFVARAQHQASVQGGSRSTNEFNADSAAWYVEGALNYSLAQAWLPYNELVNDSLVVSIPGTDGSVNETDAANAYVALLGQLQQAIGADQHLVVVDAEPVVTDAGLQLKLNYALGQGDERLALNTTYAANTHLYMMAGMGSTGSCDPNFYSLKAADRVIQDRVGATIPLLALGQYYASVESWYVDAYSGTDMSQFHYHVEDFTRTGNTSGHSNQDYKIYFCDDGNCSICLDAGDMTVHTQGTYDVMQWINQQHCPTKVPASISVIGDFPVGTGPYFHAVTYTYGKPQYHRN